MHALHDPPRPARFPARSRKVPSGQGAETRPVRLVRPVSLVAAMMTAIMQNTTKTMVMPPKATMARTTRMAMTGCRTDDDGRTMEHGYGDEDADGGADIQIKTGGQ